MAVDDEGVRNALVRILESEGHRVTTARNGVVGLRALESASFDLVITDVVMPDMEGLEFLRQIRRMVVRPKTIVMSGGGRAFAGDYLALASHFGADGTLEKPISMLDLLQIVARVMQG